MIEAGANEVPEEKMIEAIYKAHEVNQKIIEFIDKIVAECRQSQNMRIQAVQFRKNCLQQCKEIVTPEEMEEAVFTDVKQVREENIRARSQKSWKKHLQIKKSGLLFLVRLYTSIRKRPFAR